MFRSSHLVLALSLAVAACSSSTADEPSDSVTLVKACLKTRCDQKSETASSYCSRCISACAGASYDCDLSSACDASCSPPSACSDADESDCVEEGFKMTLPTAKSAEVASECDRLVDRASECRWQLTESLPCETWAKTDLPERASTYSCLADLACDATTDAFDGCAPPVSDFGDRFYDAMPGTCAEFFAGDLRLGLNARGGWLKDSIMSAAIECFSQPTCREAQACVAAWAEAIHL